MNFTINLNGNTAADIADTLYNLREALNKASAALNTTRPHGRNYPMADGGAAFNADYAAFDAAALHLHELNSYANGIEKRLIHEQNRMNGLGGLNGK